MGLTAIASKVITDYKKKKKIAFLWHGDFVKRQKSQLASFHSSFVAVNDLH